MKRKKISNRRTLRVVRGNLAGIQTPEFGKLRGFGIYAENAYLHGTVNLVSYDSLKADMMNTDYRSAYRRLLLRSRSTQIPRWTMNSNVLKKIMLILFSIRSLSTKKGLNMEIESLSPAPYETEDGIEVRLRFRKVTPDAQAD